MAQSLRACAFMAATWLLSGLCAGGELRITPQAGVAAGATAYRILIPVGTDIGYLGSTVTGFAESELSFPLGCAYAGVRVQYTAAISGGPQAPLYRGALFGQTNMDDPAGPMTDNDWIGLSVNDQSATGTTETRTRLNFSNTKSSVRLRFYEGGGSLERECFNLFSRVVSLGLAYRYSYASYGIFGVTGWQYSGDTATGASAKVYFDTLHNYKVLSYETASHCASLTASMPLMHTRTYDWSLTIDLSPLSLAYDKDLHLLRNKQSLASTRGFAAGCETSLCALLSQRLSLSAIASARYARNRGSSEQYWYADETREVNGVPEVAVAQGTSYTDIDTIISSFVARLWIGLQYKW